MHNRNGKQLARVLVLSLAAAVAALAQPQQQPQPQMPPVAANGSVSGVVTNSVTGAPLSNARVAVIVLGNTVAQTFAAVTDAEGKFTIGKLPPGRFIINVDHVGFVAPATANRSFDSQLRQGEKKEDVKLTLTPTGGISGRVLNAEGGDVQGAIVSLDGAAFGINPTTTDEKGQFRINSVPPGRYRVVANPAVMPFPPEIRTDGTSEVHYARTYYPDALTMRAGQRVEVAAGTEVTGIDIRLVRTPIVTLSGRVRDMPAGGKTSVRAVASAATGGGVQMANTVKADGSFQIWQLDPGKYTVVATSATQGSGSQGSLQSGPVEIEVEGADIGNVELRMIPPFDVSVKLAFDDAKAREMPTLPARPGQGGPLQPTPRRIVLRPEGQIFTNAAMFQPIEVGDDDSFTLLKLLPGRYRLTATWGVYVKSVTVGDTETEGDILDLRNGPAGAVTVAIGAVTGEVSGVVSDSSGPAASVRVVMMADRGLRGNPISVMSAADGTYKFAAVPPGKYNVIAGDSETVMQFQAGRDPEEYADIAESIEVHAGDKMTKALKKRVSGER